ncbi:MAG: hypothetical protein FJZ47_08285 [Candidatus Tectomicrobia bacterium]|uniref:Phosphoenolpyruvate protein kinase n=1 Tax=Tectimicrobiota bacterium TaxID=2528274 RepID=A0A937W234_UNCTE|nr:hypothetical protein [Candidatus Tectomicrobia bacterium]
MASQDKMGLAPHWRARLQVLRAPRVLRQASLAAVLVGSILIALNQGDVLLSGQISGQVVVRSLLTPLIPFCVTLLSAVLNSGVSPSRGVPRPGRAALRRSLLMALVVGGVIVLLNQGHLLFAGAFSPRLWIKMLLTPCVPFCVSMYGAYVAYWHATRQH